MVLYFESRRRICAVVLLVAVFASFSFALAADPQASEAHEHVYETESQHVFRLPPPPNASQSPTESSHVPSADEPPPNTTTYTPLETNVLRDLHTALSDGQDHYFSLWLGKWTTAIDWTAAVMGTYVSATLSSLSRSINYTMPGTFDKSRKLDVEAQMVENEINKYFAQSVAYYFGEDHFAIRMQAFDDILWVVLGWLESIQFIELHSSTHYTPDRLGQQGYERGDEWHASQFLPAFAHRARVFYELAEEGWDWRLCGGGMTWNPRLLPYKNAITNQLFISASISMYLHFSGDENCSPFLSQYGKSEPEAKELYDECDEGFQGRYNPVYLANAVNGYDWLDNSGMKNDQGLYVDGFHIGGYRQNRSKTTCDERNEMVYTYNQGVVLSGLRGLWEATGNLTYLEDGHELIRNVIRATGWTNSNIVPTPSFTAQQRVQKRDQDLAKEKDALPSDWHGLGSQGILTELCDPSGRCNEDGQAFKGIFFHHLTTFCTPLPTRAVRPGKTHAATREVAMLHRKSCDEYAGWVIHNARAALRTRDSEGRFGSWWGPPSTPEYPSSTFPSSIKQHSDRSPPSFLIPERSTDYRNVPNLLRDLDLNPWMSAKDDEPWVDSEDRLYKRRYVHIESEGDANDRGRGRTVETQGSGVAVVRAMWEFLRRAEGAGDIEL